MEYVKPMIRIDQYEKLVDDIFPLGRNVILRLNVVLSKYSDKFGRRSYHQEFEYFNKNAHSNTVTLRRDFDFFLSLENIVAEEDIPKQFIMITMCDILGINMFLQDICRWFEDREFAGLYAYRDKDLLMTKQVNPITIQLSSGRAYLMAEPMVYVDRFNEKEPGVRLYLSSDLNYVEMPLFRIKGLQYFFLRTDIYGCACAMVNYLQRPDLGTNLTSYSSSYAQKNTETSIPKSPAEGRKVQDRGKSLNDL